MAKEKDGETNKVIDTSKDHMKNYDSTGINSKNQKMGSIILKFLHSSEISEQNEAIAYIMEEYLCQLLFDRRLYLEYIKINLNAILCIVFTVLLG